MKDTEYRIQDYVCSIQDKDLGRLARIRKQDKVGYRIQD